MEILFCRCDWWESLAMDGGGSLAAKSCLSLEIPWTVARQKSLSMGFPRQEYWNGLPFCSSGRLFFPTQRSKLGLLHRRKILYWLSHQESPWVIELSLQLLKKQNLAMWCNFHAPWCLPPISQLYQQMKLSLWKNPQRCLSHLLHLPVFLISFLHSVSIITRSEGSSHSNASIHCFLLTI